MAQKINDCFSDMERQGKTSRYMAQLRYRLRRLKAELCLWPGCQEQRLTQYCQKHRDARNAYYRAKRKAEKSMLSP